MFIALHFNSIHFVSRFRYSSVVLPSVVTLLRLSEMRMYCLSSLSFFYSFVSFDVDFVAAWEFCPRHLCYSYVSYWSRDSRLLISPLILFLLMSAMVVSVVFVLIFIFYFKGIFCRVVAFLHIWSWWIFLLSTVIIGLFDDAEFMKTLLFKLPYDFCFR